MITPITLLTRTTERLKSIFSRRPNLFITRLIEQSLLVQEGTTALTDYMGKPSGKNANSVRDYEKQADEVRRLLIDELKRTFVTPIDREDLYA